MSRNNPGVPNINFEFAQPGYQQPSKLESIHSNLPPSPKARPNIYSGQTDTRGPSQPKPPQNHAAVANSTSTTSNQRMGNAAAQSARPPNAPWIPNASAQQTRSRPQNAFTPLRQATSGDDPFVAPRFGQQQRGPALQFPLDSDPLDQDSPAQESSASSARRTNSQPSFSSPASCAVSDDCSQPSGQSQPSRSHLSQAVGQGQIRSSAFGGGRTRVTGHQPPLLSRSQPQSSNSTTANKQQPAVAQPRAVSAGETAVRDVIRSLGVNPSEILNPMIRPRAMEVDLPTVDERGAGVDGHAQGGDDGDEGAAEQSSEEDYEGQDEGEEEDEDEEVDDEEEGERNGGEDGNVDQDRNDYAPDEMELLVFERTQPISSSIPTSQPRQYHMSQLAPANPSTNAKAIDVSLGATRKGLAEMESEILRLDRERMGLIIENAKLHGKVTSLEDINVQTRSNARQTLDGFKLKLDEIRRLHNNNETTQSIITAFEDLKSEIKQYHKHVEKLQCLLHQKGSEVVKMKGLLEFAVNDANEKAAAAEKHAVELRHVRQQLHDSESQRAVDQRKLTIALGGDLDSFESIIESLKEEDLVGKAVNFREVLFSLCTTVGDQQQAKTKADLDHQQLVDGLEAAKEELKEAKIAAEKKLAERVQAVALMEQEEDRIKEEHASVVADLKAAVHGKEEALKQEQSQSKEGHDRLVSEIADLKQQLSNANDTYKEQRVQLQNLLDDQKDVKDAYEALGAIKGQVGGLKVLLDDTEKKNGQLQLELKEAQERNSQKLIDLCDEIKKQAEEMAKYKVQTERLAHVEKEKTAAKNKVTSLEKELKQAWETSKSFEQQLAVAKKELEDAVKHAEEQKDTAGPTTPDQKKSAALREKLAYTEDKARLLQARVDEQGQTITHLQRTQGDGEKRLSRETERVETQKQNVERLQKQVQQLQEDLTKAQAEVKRISGEAESAAFERAAELAEKTAKVVLQRGNGAGHLQAEVDRLQRLLKEKEQELVRTVQSHDSKSAELSKQLQAKVQELEKVQRQNETVLERHKKQALTKKEQELVEAVTAKLKQSEHDLRNKIKHLEKQLRTEANKDMETVQQKSVSPNQSTHVTPSPARPPNKYWETTSTGIAPALAQPLGMRRALGLQRQNALMGGVPASSQVPSSQSPPPPSQYPRQRAKDARLSAASTIDEEQEEEMEMEIDELDGTQPMDVDPATENPATEMSHKESSTQPEILKSALAGGIKRGSLSKNPKVSFDVEETEALTTIPPTDAKNTSSSPLTDAPEEAIPSTQKASSSQSRRGKKRIEPSTEPQEEPQAKTLTSQKAVSKRRKTVKF